MTPVRLSPSYRTAAVLLPLLMILCGCASTSEIDFLRSDVNNLKIESNTQKREISQIKDRVTQISKDSTASSAIIESQASLLKQSLDLSKEVQGMRGQFDENKYQTDRRLKELLVEREMQQTRLRQIEDDLKEIKARLGMLASDRRPEGAEKAPPAPEARGPHTLDPNDPQQLYESAYGEFREKKFADARVKFEKFAKDFPKHSLASNAQFWIGETYYNEKKFEDAILAYESVVKKYPSDSKARAAMLKQGYAFIELGDRKTGKVVLERVMEKYPRSPEAELAEKKIAEILSKEPGQSKPKTPPKKR